MGNKKYFDIKILENWKKNYGCMLCDLTTFYIVLKFINIPK